jgi:hypothetical protein
MFARGGEPLMMDAIQRMHRERRVALLIFGVFVLVAVVVHCFVVTPIAYAPPTVSTEAVE